MDYREIYQSWLNDARLCGEAAAELKAFEGNNEEIEYRFGAELKFGTAGMRGIIGFGTNMMNVYTVKRATQGLAEFIKSKGGEAMERGVAISYDTRLKSDEFAQACAEVLAYNNVTAHLFPMEHPVPMLSFAVRELNAFAGIMITASHNPKQYNGYKVYGEDGAQMSPDDTAEVVKFINNIKDFLDPRTPAPEQKLKYVKIIPVRIDKKYYDELEKLTISKQAIKKYGKDLKLVYTPVHGSGYIPVTTILKRIGINATVVEEQVKKDTDFSTVEVPNPEFKETLSMGVKYAEAIGATVVFGTDPDSDRLGVAVKNDVGEFEVLSGNQVGILLLDYILTRLKEEGAMPENPAVVKSFVTTGMAKAICARFGVTLFEVPVGFKFIGEKIKQWEQPDCKKPYSFIFGFEESCGYLRGTHARDKDAVVASMICAEMVCYYSSVGKTVYQRLTEIYETYGYVLDSTLSVPFKGLHAMDDMNKVVDGIKAKPATKFDIYNVAAVRDYSENKRYDLATGTVTELGSPKTNSIYFEFENGSFICIRPSGTEPKLKIYFSVKMQKKKDAEEALEKMQAAAKKLIGA